MKSIKKIRNRKMVVGLLVASLMVFVNSFIWKEDVQAASYDASAAVNYSYSHYNDGKGLCAEFVSDCLRNGGCGAYSANTSALLSQLQSGGYGTLYALSSGGRQELFANQYGNAGKVSVGDPIFFRCNTCGTWPHVAIASKIDGNGVVYCNQHNPAQTNMHYLFTYYNNSHAGHQFAVYSFHMQSHSHSYSSQIINPTCTTQGYTVHRCSCGASYTDGYQAALGHSYGEYSVSKAATCTQKGMKVRRCSRCGASETASIASMGHIFTNACDATCNRNGCNYKRSIKHTYSSGEWIYTDKLPSGVTSQKYTIEYNNLYEKNAVDSPGNGWKRGKEISSKYVNSGSTYASDGIALPTSDTRILLGYNYFHYCGGSVGHHVNFTIDGGYVHYDAILNPGLVYEVAQKTDVDDSRYTYYQLKWNDGTDAYCHSGTTCDATYGEHGNRSCYWYKSYLYQNRIKQTTYRWTKESGWTSAKDEKASGVKYRYRSNNVSVVPATTTKEGTIYSSCTICGHTDKVGTIAKVGATVLSKNTFAYNGKVNKPQIIVRDCKGKVLAETRDYSVVYSNPSSTKVGEYKIKINFKGDYSGHQTFSYRIKKNQTVKITPDRKTIKYKKLKKKSQTFQLKIKGNKGKVKYASNSKYIKVNSKGKVTVKRKTPKGTYRITISARETSKYAGMTKKITIKVK